MHSLLARTRWIVLLAWCCGLNSVVLLGRPVTSVPTTDDTEVPLGTASRDALSRGRRIVLVGDTRHGIGSLIGRFHLDRRIPPEALLAGPVRRSGGRTAH